MRLFFALVMLLIPTYSFGELVVEKTSSFTTVDGKFFYVGVIKNTDKYQHDGIIVKFKEDYYPYGEQPPHYEIKYLSGLETATFILSWDAKLIAKKYKLPVDEVLRKIFFHVEEGKLNVISDVTR